MLCCINCCCYKRLEGHNIKLVKMIKLLIVSVLVLVLTSCNGIDRPVFERMSMSALATYNTGVADNDKVVCFGERGVAIGDDYRHIPNTCLTVGEIIRSKPIGEYCPVVICQWPPASHRWTNWAGAGGTMLEGYTPAYAAGYPGAFNQGHMFGPFRITFNGVPL